MPIPLLIIRRDWALSKRYAGCDFKKSQLKNGRS